MKRSARAMRLTATTALILLLMPGTRLIAQAFNVEREFPQSAAAVEKAVSEIRPTAKGRLPTLDGFVGTTDQPLDRYKSGYYECTIKLSPGNSGGTMVRVVAKITAWYTDANPARSGYRTLPSNGRLETDLLDRLADVLEPTAKGGASTPPREDSPSPPSAPPLPSLPAPLADRGVPAYLAPSGAGSALPPATAGATRAPGSGRTGALAGERPGEEAAATEPGRLQSEQHTKELRAMAQNLEEILRNQSRPENLAAVRVSGTPVYAKPQTTAQVLFSADSQDEFQILEVQPGWVHLQISGASRAWIRRAQLELPGGFAEASTKTGDAVATGTRVTFRVTRESERRFPGGWQPLRGKMVKVFDVEPTAGMATSAKQKRDFARSLLDTARPASSAGAESLAGIVVIFDSADGGQVSVTLTDLKQFQEGRISEAVFWQRCSLDPPETFQVSGKP